MIDYGKPLEGTTALVTGAGSGIGSGGALSFAALGANVMVADIDLESAHETATRIKAMGGTAAVAVCDVTSEIQVTAMIAATISAFGSLDSAFNNAGNAMAQFRIHELPVEEWEQSLRINLTSTFLCVKHELAHMLVNGGGCIVNTASGAAKLPAPGRAPYSAAKRGVVALTAHVAADYASEGIRSNAVLPGLIDTPGVRANYPDGSLEQIAQQLPGGQLGQPSDIGDVAAWLCTDAARHINGQALVVDGGGILA
ncbi:MAG: SDR family NAD(P)-dependent oxidoreductase [Acidimicrobiales bacterium]